LKHTQSYTRCCKFLQRWRCNSRLNDWLLDSQQNIKFYRKCKVPLRRTYDVVLRGLRDKRSRAGILQKSMTDLIFRAVHKKSVKFSKKYLLQWLQPILTTLNETFFKMYSYFYSLQFPLEICKPLLDWKTGWQVWTIVCYGQYFNDRSNPIWGLSFSSEKLCANYYMHCWATFWAIFA
jgi:hypothetical protein